MIASVILKKRNLVGINYYLLIARKQLAAHWEIYFNKHNYFFLFGLVGFAICSIDLTILITFRCNFGLSFLMSIKDSFASFSTSPFLNAPSALVFNLINTSTVQWCSAIRAFRRLREHTATKGIWAHSSDFVKRTIPQNRQVKRRYTGCVTSIPKTHSVEHHKPTILLQPHRLGDNSIGCHIPRL